MPCRPSASFTSSSLKGLTMASTIFMGPPLASASRVSSERVESLEQQDVRRAAHVARIAEVEVPAACRIVAVLGPGQDVIGELIRDGARDRPHGAGAGLRAQHRVAATGTRRQAAGADAFRIVE